MIATGSAVAGWLLAGGASDGGRISAKERVSDGHLHTSRGATEDRARDCDQLQCVCCWCVDVRAFGCGIGQEIQSQSKFEFPLNWIEPAAGRVVVGER